MFDLDGTLVDSAWTTCAIIGAMLETRGIVHAADPALARAMHTAGGEAMIAAMMGPHCHDPPGDIAEFRTRNTVIATPADLAFPGVADGLAVLVDSGLAMAIRFNKPEALCAKIPVDLDLARHLGANDDDTAVDVAKAQAAGLRIALLDWAYVIAAASSMAPNAPMLATMAALIEHVYRSGQSRSSVTA